MTYVEEKLKGRLEAYRLKFRNQENKDEKRKIHFSCLPLFHATKFSTLGRRNMKLEAGN
jgi:hypothetical protein